MSGEIQKNNEESNFENNSVIKKYFSRIFTILKSDIKEKLENLDISDKKKKKIKQELSFLPYEKQIEYLDEISENFQSSKKLEIK